MSHKTLDPVYFLNLGIIASACAGQKVHQTGTLPHKYPPLSFSSWGINASCVRLHLRNLTVLIFIRDQQTEMTTVERLRLF